MAVHVRYKSLYISAVPVLCEKTTCNNEQVLHILENGGYYDNFFFLTIDRWHYIFRYVRFSDRSSIEQIQIVAKFKLRHQEV